MTDYAEWLADKLASDQFCEEEEETDEQADRKFDTELPNCE